MLNEMWVILACLSALFAGITAILAKIGLKDVDSSLATALRTIVVLFCAFVMVLIVGSFNQIKTIDFKTFILLMLSGLATGASWLCYFKALSIGDVNKVVPIDKTSTILTMILAFIIFQESLSLLKIISMIIMLIGTMLMIEHKKSVTTNEKSTWLMYACGSAIFASLTTIIAKLGMSNIDSNLGTFIRTIFVLIMAWVMVFVQGSHHDIKKINNKNYLFLFLSGITTGLSWLCYYKALQLGDASIVAPIDKLSIVVTIIFSYFILKEKLTLKSLLGLGLIVLGTVLLLI